MTDTPVTDDWHNLYGERWGADLVPLAFAHPAKVNRGLARAIYRHCIDEGWAAEGSTVLDPFGGIGGFALDALTHGLHFVGVELEQRFVDMAMGYDCPGFSREDWRKYHGKIDRVNYRDGHHWCPECHRDMKKGEESDIVPPAKGPHHYEGNIEFWNRKYGKHFRRWGTAVVIQGDSRKLVSVLRDSSDLSVSSPPYSTSDNRGETDSTTDGSRREGGPINREGYGDTPGNLGNMPADRPDATVSSSPFGTDVGGGDTPARQGKGRENGRPRGGTTVTMRDGGNTEGQLATLPQGKVDTVVSSSPYARSMDSERHGIDWKKAEKDYPGRRIDDSRAAMQDRHVDGRRYGSAEGQIGSMPEGDVDAAVGSPPFASTALKGGETKGFHSHDGNEPYNRMKRDYEVPDGEGQLGTMREGDIDGAVGSPPFIAQSGGTNVTSKDGPLADRRLLDRHSAGNVAARGYGESGGQLGMMREGEVEVVVSSSPFVDNNVNIGSVGNTSAMRQQIHNARKRNESYGGTDGQMGNMKEGEADLSVSSSPYVSGGHHPDQTGAWGGKAQSVDREVAGYGREKGQMGRMEEGRTDLSVSSPAYAGISQSGGREGLQKHGTGLTQGERSFDEYGESEGQLGRMPDVSPDTPDTVLSSPPYEGIHQDGGGEFAQAGKGGSGAYTIEPPDAWHTRRDQDNLGNNEGNTFWSAARLILEQVYAILKPGGHSVWVTKSYIRKGKRVDFPGQWQRLCESVGFETVHVHRAWMVEYRGAQYTLEGELVENSVERKSFFRRLAEQKGAPRIDYEVVLCMRKPAEPSLADMLFARAEVAVPMVAEREQMAEPVPA